MRAVIVGAGAVGARAGRQIMALGSPDDVVIVDAQAERAQLVAKALGSPARVEPGLPSLGAGDVVLLATPAGPDRPIHGVARGQPAIAEAAVSAGAHVVSVSDSVGDVRALLDLDARARERGVHLVAGAGFAPGLACVLVALGVRSFSEVDEIHVAKVGTGGPACARRHHRALGGQTFDWRDGAWVKRRGGSGRELCWFPDPVRGVDCYRAGLPDPLLLVDAFPGVKRVTARMGATRRDRLTAKLPMLRRPHPEGGLGAIRVEIRGSQGAVRDDRVLGAVDRPAVAAGAVAALACCWAAEGRLARTGAAGLAALVEPGPFLAVLAERGVKVAVFEGGQHVRPEEPATR